MQTPQYLTITWAKYRFPVKCGAVRRSYAKEHYVYDLKEYKRNILNPTQTSLAKEICTDRLIPIMSNLLKQMPNDEHLQCLMSLIILATSASLDPMEYKTMLNELLGTVNSKTKNILSSLFYLFQNENNLHVFLYPIIDNRFYVKNASFTQKKWTNKCIEELKAMYATALLDTLKEYNSAIYTKACEAPLQTQLEEERNSSIPLG